MATCSACGADVPDNQKYCHTCGKSMSSSSTADEQVMSRLETLDEGTTSPSEGICQSCGAALSSHHLYCPICGDSTEPEPRDSLLGTTIADNFLIEDLLGEGAMGKVYRARQLSLDKIVAIKVLHPHLAGDRNIARRFHREARAASRLNHPNSLHIIDFGQTDDRTLYIAMEFIEGRDLHEIIKEDFPLPLGRIVGLIGEVCLALDEAHAAGIVHRDLKPENIMVVTRRDGQEQVKVCDFGIAKIQDPGDTEASAPITVAGIVCGTPEYMSPEQCRGEDLDGRADLYSIGVILYQLAANALPFVADTPLGVVTRQLTDAPVPPTLIQERSEVATALEPIVLKAMTKDRDLRYGSALELKKDLERVLAGETITAPATKLVPQPEKRKTGWPAITAAAAFATLATLLGVWLLMPGASDAPTDRLSTPESDGDELTSALLSKNAPREEPDAGLALADAGPAGSDADLISADDADGAEQDLEDGVRSTLVAAPERRQLRRQERHKNREIPETPEKTPDETEVKTAPQKGAFELGRAAFQTGNISQAIRHFEQAKSSNPNNANVHLMLGKCYFRVGQTGQGRAAYRRYLQLRPNAPNRAFIESIINN